VLAYQRANTSGRFNGCKWVVASDALFPEGGYQLSVNGKQTLNQYLILT